MSLSRHHRPILFFLAAVLLPCSVLVVLSVRMMRQDQELAAKRVADEQQGAVNDLRRELLIRLEAIKSTEVGSLRDTNGEGRMDARSSELVALVARVERGQPVLPWEIEKAGDRVACLLTEQPAATKLSEGEREEFVAKDLQGATAYYAEAARLATNPTQRAHAELMYARAQMRAGEGEKAVRAYSSLLTLPDNIVDRDGVPVFLYAGAGLVDSEAEEPAVFERIWRFLSSGEGVTPITACLTADLLEGLQGASTGAASTLAGKALRNLREKSRFFERAQALQRDFQSLGLGRQLNPDAAQEEPLWVPYGKPRWLVSVQAAERDAPPIMVAVRAEVVLTAVVQTAAWVEGRLGLPKFVSDGEPLGPAFPGLAAGFAVQTRVLLAQEGGLRRWFYPATLALVLSVTLFVAYLLWRDLRRELRLVELRTEFVSSVSHELKTPLTAIRMFAETLSLGRVKEPGAQVEYLETIVNESQRLTRLLNNVLDFSKIEQGNKTYRLQPTNLAEAVQAAARSMHYPLAQQGFQLRVDIEDGLPAVPADADAVEQAILNLLANAMKYAGQSCEICLRLQRRDRDLVIQVSDRGVGIPLEEQARIFQKFYRVPAPELPRVPGTGLGLTLVRHIARAHGGEVLVESAPGKGSTFSIRIPVENLT